MWRSLRLLLFASSVVLIPATMKHGHCFYRWACGVYAKSQMTNEDHRLAEYISRLEPIHESLGKPKPGDWLATQHECGQTFAEYIGCDPVRPQGNRTQIYVQPIGDMTETQRQIVELSAEFMGLYFNCEIVLLSPLSADVIPAHARRMGYSKFGEQFLSTYLWKDLLKSNLPPDALASIAFTATDLWPGEGWNYVFGQASTVDRVGVWSMARFGDPDESAEAFQTSLVRTLGTATHETGHMLSIKHCTAYECNMCGSNTLEEGDRHPIYLCPRCLTKVCWATRTHPLERFEKLAEFCQRHNMAEAESYYRRAIELLR